VGEIFFLGVKMSYSVMESNRILGNLSKEELIQMNYQLLIRVQEQAEQIKRQETIINRPSLTPLLDRPRPPTRPRHNSLPDSTVGYQPQPTIYEIEEDKEVEETFYTTLINELEKTKAKQKKEITGLNREIKSLENQVLNFQAAEEEKIQDLKILKRKNSQLLKEQAKLETDKQKVEQELNLTNEDFLERAGTVDKLNKELLAEKKCNELLEARLTAEYEANQEAEIKRQELANQIAKLHHDKNLLDQEKEQLKQVITEQATEYQTK
jgi:hypothetical protein